MEKNKELKVLIDEKTLVERIKEVAKEINSYFGQEEELVMV